MRRALIGPLTLLALAGCDQVGDPLTALGARPPAPDEFRIVAREPLVVPEGVRGGTNASLPSPRPGARSPLEPDPQSVARAALLGGGVPAGSVATGGTVAGEPSPAPSPAERALLATAAANADTDIRETLGADAARAEAEAEAEFEPPTIAELFGFGDAAGPDPETLIDPVAESQRLQRRGVAAPNDPDAVAPEIEAAAEGAAEERAPSPRDRRTRDGTLIPAPF